MKFFKLIFSLSAFFIFSACEDLPFNDEDFVLPKEQPVQETPAPKGENKEAPNVAENKEEISEEEETTTLSEDFELSENTIIQNKKVVLDMITIQTLQHDLTIMAEEFVSNHSFIRNFPEKQTAEDKANGRNGGHVLIKARTTKGSLGLILSGENGGYVPERKISRRERNKLGGRDGASGYNAVYDTWCSDFYIPAFIGKIVLDRDCWKECRLNPTLGEDGEDGRQGHPGYTGKKGGDSGSFHLQAFNLSDFYLTDVQKTVGLGSRGGKGSKGGYGGSRGHNGEDRKGLCSPNLPEPKSGKQGRRGRRGKKGKDGKEGAVCLENLQSEKNQTPESIQIKIKSVETNSSQSIETKCEENESGIMCREVLIENKPVQDLKQKENVICY